MEQKKNAGQPSRGEKPSKDIAPEIPDEVEATGSTDESKEGERFVEAEVGGEGEADVVDTKKTEPGKKSLGGVGKDKAGGKDEAGPGQQDVDRPREGGREAA